MVAVRYVGRSFSLLMDERIERFSFSFGVSYDSYLINDGNRKIFESQRRDGLLGYIQDGKYAHVIGGLLAESVSAKVALVEEFLVVAKKEGFKTVLFHNILEEDLILFEGMDFEATKCGEEAVIDLPLTDWKGKPYEWVRRQENFCQRKGLVAGELDLDPEGIDSSLLDELQLISDLHVKQTTTGKEFSYFAGRLILSDLRRKRIFIAKSVDRIEAFIVCNPGLAGKFYAIEMYRYRRDAPRGVMPFLWMQALRQFKGEGVAMASLCMMPFYNCETPHPRDNTFLRFCNSFWYRNLNWLFNAKGLRLYKSRFRPRGRSMFTVAYPRTSLGSLMSAFKLWELSSVLTPRSIMSRLFRFGKKTPV